MYMRPFDCSSKLLVQLDDHVVVKGDKSGTIRYIGHIDRSRQSSVLYVGLELDTPGTSLPLLWYSYLGFTAFHSRLFYSF